MRNQKGDAGDAALGILFFFIILLALGGIYHSIWAENDVNIPCLNRIPKGMVITALGNGKFEINYKNRTTVSPDFTQGSNTLRIAINNALLVDEVSR